MVDFPIRREDCALLIYDLTQELLEPQSPDYVPWVVEQMPNLQRLGQACRTAAVPVFYAVPPYSLEKLKVQDPHEAVCAPIRPLAEDSVFLHRKPGGFTGTQFEALLRERGRTTLLITGMAVDRGCNTAARTPTIATSGR